MKVRAPGGGHTMSSDQPIVVLIHGMGKHAPGEIKQSFSAAINAAMRQYRGFRSKRIQDLVTLEEINYDHVFENVREQMGQYAGRNSVRLGAISSFADISLGLDLAPKLAAIDSRLGKDEFLYTHFLDVVFYTTILGGKVRVDVARQLARIVAENSTRRVHVVAHSLGTAVLHDSLAMLYRNDMGLTDDIPILDPVTHKLASIWMIANVSQLVYSTTRLADPLRSVVRPAPGGCTNLLVNVRHRYDPFTWFGRFDPENDESWIPRRYFNRGYKLIETNSIRQPNTHDFADYVENPKVSVPLLRRLVRLSPTRAELGRIASEYRQRAIPGALERVRNALKNVRFKDRATLAELASQVRYVREIIQQLTGRHRALAH
jgi:hypothetical protein